MPDDCCAGTGNVRSRSTGVRCLPAHPSIGLLCAAAPPASLDITYCILYIVFLKKERTFIACRIEICLRTCRKFLLKERKISLKERKIHGFLLPAVV
ncbi:hypothetical protein BHK98_10565 [Hornefia porci]|uniref:Uncharacterized protein n=1 Tax=Hornefia porci TaxID=2652292 RepID=A0A1Q9JJT6_9FIRM|nr:hypothetical protein BHK98_10565 [Hornefia porci]